MLSKKRIKELRTSTVVCKFNYKLLPEIMKFFLKFDLTAYHISPVIIDGNAYLNRQTVVVSMSESAPYVHKAIDEAWKMEKQVSVYSFPFCLMQGYERAIAELGKRDTILMGPDFTASIQEHRHKDRVKAESCKKCKYDKICLGVWKRYVDMFGFGEFKPVLGKTIKSGDELWR